MPEKNQAKGILTSVNPGAVWVTSLVVIAAIWATVVWLDVSDYRKAITSAFDDTEQSTHKLADATQRTLDQTNQTLMLVRYLVERDGHVDLSALSAAGLLGRADDIVVSITDADGQILQSTRGVEARKIAIVNSEAFAKARAVDAVVYGEPLYGRVTNRWVIPTAIRVRGPDGQFAGAVLAGIDASMLTRDYQHDTDPDTMITVLRRDGVILSRLADGRQESGTRLSAEQTARVFRPHPLTAPLRAVADGSLRFPTVVPVTGTDLYAIVSTTAQSRLAPHVQLRNALLSVGAGLSLLVLVVAGHLSREGRLARDAALRRRQVTRSHAAVLNAIPVQIALLRPDGTIASVNHDWAHHPQIASAALPDAGLGQSYVDVRSRAFGGSADVLARIEAAVRDVGSGALDVVRLEYQATSTQSEAWFQLSTVAAEIDDERCVVALHWDISERKVAERASVRNAVLNRIAGSVARIGGWVLEAGSESFALSEELRVLLDLPKSTDVGVLDSKRFYAPEWLAQSITAFTACRGQGVPYDLEVEMISATGRRFWARSIGDAVLDQSGAVVFVQGAIQDITERKRTELEAADARDQLDIALDSMTVAFCIVDRDWRFSYVNPETEWLLRTTRSELIGRELREILPPEACTEIERQAGLPRDHSAAVEIRAFASPAGEWLEARVHTCASGLAIYMRDTTLERRTQQHLRLMEACVARMNDLVLITEAKGDAFLHKRITFANDAFVQRTGYTADELLQSTPSLLRGKDTSAGSLQRIEAAVHATTAVREELVSYTKSGEPFWVELDIVPVYDDDGRATHFLSVGRDVTQNKLARETLADSNRALETRIAARTAQLAFTNASLLEKEHEIRSVLQNMAEGVLTIDQQGRIRSANAMVETLFGYAGSTLVGESLASLIPGSVHQVDSETILLPGTSGSAGTLLTGIHRNGESISIDVSFSEYAFKDQRRITAIVRDMRERLRALAELKQARVAAEEASTAKSAFVATMSHEIRTPMSGVIGLIELLGHTQLDEDQSQLVDMARESANSLMGVVESILDFSKIEAGKVDVELVEMSLHHVVEKAFDLAHSIAESQGVSLTLFVDPSVPNLVLGDSVKIRQILLNLMSNAIKFSAGREIHGRVSLRVNPVVAADGRPRIEFAIADNGIGMDAQTLGRLFQSFNQADASTTRRFGGTGLGLTIARELTRLLGGDIGVESTLGVGSVFRLDLGFQTVTKAVDWTPAREACRCVLLAPDSTFKNDLTTYLLSSGCTIRPIEASELHHFDDAMPAGETPSVVIFVGGVDEATVERIRSDSRSPYLAGLQWLGILEGGPRSPKRCSPGLVVINRTTLTARRLRTAVAMLLQPERSIPAAQPSDDRAKAVEPLDVLPILVAEDSEINQHVIEAQLARLGYRAHIANDGYHALELFDSGSYSMVLTDLRMPQMDGFALVAAIRARERDGQRIPVIALTANALKDEADRCLAAGMDGYASKPLAFGALQRLLAKWSPGPSPAASALEPGRNGPLDFEVIASTLGTRESTVQDFLRRFRDAAKNYERSILKACRQGNWAEAGDLAHQLKSNARTFGATELGRICAALEAAADGSEQARIQSILPELRTSIREIVTFIDLREAAIDGSTAPAPLS